MVTQEPRSLLTIKPSSSLPSAVRTDAAPQDPAASMLAANFSPSLLETQVKLCTKVGTARDPSLREEPRHQLLLTASPLTAWASAQFRGRDDVVLQVGMGEVSSCPAGASQRPGWTLSPRSTSSTRTSALNARAGGTTPHTPTATHRCPFEGRPVPAQSVNPLKAASLSNLVDLTRPPSRLRVWETLGQYLWNERTHEPISIAGSLLY